MTKIAHHSVPPLFILAGALLPFAGLSPISEDFVILSAYYLLLAGSWNLLAGFTGQYSFAHIGLAAAGAYGTAGVIFLLDLPGWAGLLLMPLAVAIVGYGLGLVSLRVRGVQLPLITFAFAGAFAVFLSAATDITGGSMGMPIPRLVEGISRAPFLVLAGVLVGTYFLLQNLVLDGRLGLLMAAVRDGENVARGMGVNVFRVKITAFVITSAVAGLAGAFYANYVGVLAPSMLSINEMGMVVAMAVVGGLGHRYGALIGVASIRLIEHVIRGFGAEYTLVTVTALTLLVVMFFREGLVVACESVIRRIIPARHRWSDTGEKPESRQLVG